MIKKIALFLIISMPIYAQEPSPAHPQISPEVLQRIMNTPPTDTTQTWQPPILPNTHRLAMVAVAISTLIIGLLVCNFLYSQKIIEEATSIYFLFGTFGGLAGISLATAFTGSFFLHIAAITCTFISGFSISAFLMPQFLVINKWLIGPQSPTKEPQ